MRNPSKTPTPQPASMAVGKKNLWLILAGLGIMVIGYLLLVGGGSSDPNIFREEALFSFRRMVLAPVVIVLGFGFEVFAIMKVFKK